MNRVWAEGQRRVMDLFENTTIAAVRHPLTTAAQPARSAEFSPQKAV
jgi:hypothetical protein